jgi:hypothetical protein
MPETVSRALFVSVAASLLFAGGAAALPAKFTPSGQFDMGYGSLSGSAGGAGTAYKPESKLFYTPDNRWWALLGSAMPRGLGLYELVDHRWRHRMTLPGSDPWHKADALFDPADRTLFVAARDNGAVSGNTRTTVLYRLSYLGGGSWSAPLGPTSITTTNPEAVTIARDSQRRLWTAWESGGEIKVKHTAPGGTSFSYTNSTTSGVGSDDLAAVTAFSTPTGPGIGVMWSDQTTQRFSFAWRADVEPIGTWHTETAYGAGVGGCTGLCSDDHVNLKVAGGEVFAAVKTSKNDVAQPAPADPLIVLLRRSPTGAWTSFPVSPVSQDASRPVVLLSPQRGAIWVFAQKAFEDVYVWESPFASPRFDSAAVAPWTVGSGTRNDPTTTKQEIPAGLPAVVETSRASTNEYWHNEFLP